MNNTRLYPVTSSGIECNDYTVRVNGREVTTDTARVSAMPFNRRWPGHQRSLDQTETVQFLSLETDGGAYFEIIPKDTFSEGDVRIRPYSLGVKPTVKNGVISFTLPKPAYFTVEAFGRRRALHIFADPISDLKVPEEKTGVYYFGKGTHEVGVLELKDGDTVFIDEGAVVYASIHAIDSKNISILGRGILDNSHNKEEILFEENAIGNTQAVGNAKRRHTVQLEYCTGVLIDGITMRDSLVYNIRPMGCRDVEIRNVKIIGCWRYNSDGIDMHNCENVHIDNCFLRTFDDSICIKGFDFYNKEDPKAELYKATYHNGEVYDTFKNVLVERCVVFNDWGKSLEIGAETKAREMCDITFRRCDIIHLTGAALDCMNVDYADVHRVTFSDINIEADELIPSPEIQNSDSDVYTLASVDADPDMLLVEVCFHHEYSKGSDERGRNRDFTFERINVYGDRKIKGCFRGYDGEHRTENVRISDLTVGGKRITSLDETAIEIGDFAEDIRLV